MQQQGTVDLISEMKKKGERDRKQGFKMSEKP